MSTITGLLLAVVENVLQSVLQCSVLRKESSRRQQWLGGVIIIITIIIIIITIMISWNIHKIFKFKGVNFGRKQFSEISKRNLSGVYISNSTVNPIIYSS